MRVTEKRYWMELVVLAVITIGLVVFFQGNVVFQVMAIISGVGIAVFAAFVDIPQVGESPDAGEHPHRSEKGINTASVFGGSDDEEK